MVTNGEQCVFGWRDGHVNVCLYLKEVCVIDAHSSPTAAGVWCLSIYGILHKQYLLPFLLIRRADDKIMPFCPPCLL